MPPQTEQGILDAVNAQLAALVATFPTGAPSVAYLGVAFQPEANQPYIATSMPAMRATTITVGTPSTAMWKGIFRVQVVWPIGQGTNDCANYMQLIRGAFPYASTLATAEGWTVIFQKPTPSGIMPDQAYLRGTVDCPWFLIEQS